MGEKAERVRKVKKLSCDGGGEGGESRVQNLPKAFGELKKGPSTFIQFCYMET